MQPDAPTFKSLEAFAKAMFEAGRRSITDGSIEVIYPLEDDPNALRFYNATRLAWTGLVNDEPEYLGA